MTQRLTLWWRARARREQILLTVAALLAALLFGWFAVVKPLAAAQEAGRARYERSVVALGTARAMVLQSRQAPAVAAPALPAPIEPLLVAAAAEAGLADAQVASAGPGRTNMRIGAVRPQVLFDWLARVEARGIRVAALRVVPNADRTVAAELSFEARVGA